MIELYPGQTYIHRHNLNVKRAEESWMEKQTAEGLGSGALREALELAKRTIDGWVENETGHVTVRKDVISKAVNAALSLSSPIEPFDEVADARRFMREIFDVDMPEHSLNETIAACASKRFWKGREVEGGVQPPQASSEVREARNVRKFYELAEKVAERDHWHIGGFLGEVWEQWLEQNKRVG